MTHPFAQFDDLQVVSTVKPDPDAMTLCAVGRNEMYFLPAFLHHYRSLGIEQFAILNDRSDDGTREYLLSQPDAVVFESNYRYGDLINLPQSMIGKISNGRILYIWRTLLYNKFAKGRWAVQVDLDEFIHLPQGTRLQDVALQMEAQGEQVALGLMLDVYPDSISALAAQAKGSEVDMGTTWYFDGEPHLRLSKKRPPQIVHPGARARLFKRYDTSRLYGKLGLPQPTYSSWLKRMKRTRFGTKIPTYNTLHKPVMAKWNDAAYFTNSHDTNMPVSSRVLLPFQHFRFTGALYNKIDMAIRENSYSAGSRDHYLLSDLLSRMRQSDGSFLYKKSCPLQDFENLVKTGNAMRI